MENAFRRLKDGNAYQQEIHTGYYSYSIMHTRYHSCDTTYNAQERSTTGYYDRPVTFEDENNIDTPLLTSKMLEQQGVL